jgi:transcriptional regulator with XRE-family HTH domain
MISVGGYALLPDVLKSGRELAGLTQQRAAERLGVSQAYLALLEGGRRRVTQGLAKKIVNLYHLSPAALPPEDDVGESWDSSKLARALAGLGYPGFHYLRRGPKRNPAGILLAALAAEDLEVRVAEALPWLVVQYSDLDWEWLVRESKQRDLQNRLGFVVTLGRRVAEKQSKEAPSRRLHEIYEALSRARLAREDTLCQQTLSNTERAWLRRTRPADARYWNLLTDLDSEHLPYAA